MLVQKYKGRLPAPITGCMKCYYCLMNCLNEKQEF